MWLQPSAPSCTGSDRRLSTEASPTGVGRSVTLDEQFEIGLTQPSLRPCWHPPDRTTDCVELDAHNVITGGKQQGQAHAGDMADALHRVRLRLWLQALYVEWRTQLEGDSAATDAAIGRTVADPDVVPFRDLRLPDSLRARSIAAARKVSGARMQRSCSRLGSSRAFRTASRTSHLGARPSQCHAADA